MEVVEIGDDEQLIRRYFVDPKRGHLLELNGRPAPTVFYGRTGMPDGECSVYAQSLMSHPREWCVESIPASMGALSVLAHLPRSRGAQVLHQPSKQRSHTVILKLTLALCAELAEKCEMLDVEPCRPAP